MPSTLLLAVAAVAAVMMIALGVWSQRRAPRVTSPIRPIAPPPSAPRPAAQRAPAPPLHLRMLQGLARHPDPLVAALKSVFWIVMFVGLVDHLRDVEHGTVAYLAWLVTIVPHEAGHFICLPFGWVLNVAGGSIWQVLIYALLALYAGWLRGQYWLALVLWAIVGHSLINLSVYIGDAAERELPLIFGLDKSHHDWWNLLSHYDALQHDDVIAAIVRNTGAVIAIVAGLVGLITAWWLPLAWREQPVIAPLPQLPDESGR